MKTGYFSQAKLCFILMAMCITPKINMKNGHWCDHLRGYFFVHIYFNMLELVASHRLKAPKVKRRMKLFANSMGSYAISAIRIDLL